MKPFLILQLRPEPEASDNEFQAILDKGGLTADQTQRICLDHQPLPATLNLTEFAGVIVGGGPGCVSDPEDRKSPLDKRMETAILGLMPEITTRDIPFLGCCYGIGILAHHLGAPVSKARFGEPVGTAQCTLTDAGRSDPLLSGCPEAFEAFVGHKEAVQALPESTAHLLAAPTCPYQMIRYKQNVYATQFHPEADGKVFETRIEIYKHMGYFPPEDASALTEMVHAADVHAPARILRNFVTRYA